MTYDEMKKTLDGLKYKKRLLRSLQRQISEARAQIDCLSGLNYEQAAVSGRQGEPAAERFVEHIERLERRYEKLMREVFAIEDYIAEHLSSLSEIEQAIIIDRYMSGKSWSAIQREHSYGEANPYKIAAKAIKKLAPKFKVDSK